MQKLTAVTQPVSETITLLELARDGCSSHYWYFDTYGQLGKGAQGRVYAGYDRDPTQGSSTLVKSEFAVKVNHSLTPFNDTFKRRVDALVYLSGSYVC